MIYVVVEELVPEMAAEEENVQQSPFPQAHVLLPGIKLP